jgi:formylglycine-generating enzyme required for sulfatase activity
MGPGTNLLSPAHSVVLTKGFYLGKYEVTQEEYEKVIGGNPSEFKGDKLPVEMVSWKDAVAFCKTLNRKERKRGWEFTLPTEAQWEYACRAGTTTAYSCGDYITSQLANFKDSGLNKTVEVGSYSANPWGFYDMHGNVREWCQDWLGPYAFKNVNDPSGPPSMGIDHQKLEKWVGTRVDRGGSWDYGPEP